jgi:hypothetical protein
VGTRKENEKKFRNWIHLESGGRLYSYMVLGKMGWSAKYLKEVDQNEETIRFWQEIFDENGNLKEIHEKYPIDKGHEKL